MVAMKKGEASDSGPFITTMPDPQRKKGAMVRRRCQVAVDGED
jgi:hypothetical protein